MDYQQSALGLGRLDFHPGESLSYCLFFVFFYYFFLFIYFIILFYYYLFIFYYVIFFFLFFLFMPIERRQR